ncbi:MAG: hypothetical protein V3S64_00165 [bacterium]
MRALYFAKPLEYRLEVSGEVFVQGQALTGTLGVTNRGSAALNQLSLELGLAYGVFKDIKEEGNQSLTLLEHSQLAKGFSLEPGAEKKEAWELPLGNAAPIMSKEGSPFILYGADLKQLGARGQIDLPVGLSPPVSAFIATLENHYAFEARASKCAGAVLETRFKPPGSYPLLDELTISMKIDDKAVVLVFNGKGKGIRGGAAGGLVAKKNSTQKTIPLEKFGFGRGLPNRGLYRELVDTMLPKIAVKREKFK